MESIALIKKLIVDEINNNNFENARKLINAVEILMNYKDFEINVKPKEKVKVNTKKDDRYYISKWWTEKDTSSGLTLGLMNKNPVELEECYEIFQTGLHKMLNKYGCCIDKPNIIIKKYRNGDKTGISKNSNHLVLVDQPDAKKIELKFPLTDGSERNKSEWVIIRFSNSKIYELLNYDDGSSEYFALIIKA